MDRRTWILSMEGWPSVQWLKTPNPVSSPQDFRNSRRRRAYKQRKQVCAWTEVKTATTDIRRHQITPSKFWKKMIFNPEFYTHTPCHDIMIEISRTAPSLRKLLEDRGGEAGTGRWEKQGRGDCLGWQGRANQQPGQSQQADGIPGGQPPGERRSDRLPGVPDPAELCTKGLVECTGKTTWTRLLSPQTTQNCKRKCSHSILLGLAGNNTDIVLTKI